MRHFSDHQVIHRADQVKSLDELVTGRCYRVFSANSEKIEPEPILLRVEEINPDGSFFVEAKALVADKTFTAFFHPYDFGITPVPYDGKYVVSRFLVQIPQDNSNL